MKNISYRLSVSIHPSRQFLSRRVLLGECNKSSVWRVLSEPWLLTSEERPQWVRLHLCRCNLYVKWIFPQVDYIRQWPLKTKCVIIFSQLWHVPLSDRAVTSWLQDRIFFSVNPLVNTHVNRHGCVRIKACVCVCVWVYTPLLGCQDQCHSFVWVYVYLSVWPKVNILLHERSHTSKVCYKVWNSSGSQIQQVIKICCLCFVCELLVTPTGRGNSIHNRPAAHFHQSEARLHLHHQVCSRSVLVNHFFVKLSVTEICTFLRSSLPSKCSLVIGCNWSLTKQLLWHSQSKGSLALELKTRQSGQIKCFLSCRSMKSWGPSYFRQMYLLP